MQSQYCYSFFQSKTKLFNNMLGHSLTDSHVLHNYIYSYFYPVLAVKCHQIWTFSLKVDPFFEEMLSTECC